MLFNKIIISLLLGGSLAVNLRNGVKTLGVDLEGLVGSTSASDPTLQARRKLAMHGMVVRDLADFAWDLMPEPDFPTIGFEGAGPNGEVRFKYNYTGTTTENVKYLSAKLLQGDCLTDATPQAVVITVETDLTAANEFQVDVDIKQDTITGTPEYTDIDVTTAMINFCMRVDYFYEDGGVAESINFHETNVTINVDLAANFTLTAISVDRIDADQVNEDVALNCEVQAYFCDDNNVNTNQPTFVQGDIMQVCVEIAEADRALYHLGDVMDMDLSQDNKDPLEDDITSGIVSSQFAIGLSDKQCRNGICNIRHQLSSKFFAERDPNDLDISGIAICAFGPLGQYTRRVNRSLNSVYVAASTGIPRNGEASIETCKTECDDRANCQAFTVTPNGNLFDCMIYEGAYPKDEQLIVDATSTVYARNTQVYNP